MTRWTKHQQICSVIIFWILINMVKLKVIHIVAVAEWTPRIDFLLKQHLCFLRYGFPSHFKSLTIFRLIWLFQKSRSKFNEYPNYTSTLACIIAL